jgi:methyl-accepting chemotaxis protein
MFRLPKLSIAAKLYVIFALMGTATLALAALAVINSRHQAALSADLESAVRGTVYVERVNGLIYAVVMESRGIYMSPDIPSAKRYGDLLLKLNERIAKVVQEWKQVVRADDAQQFDEFSKRFGQFLDFRRELVRPGTEINPAAGREWGDNEANRSRAHGAQQDRRSGRDITATIAAAVTEQGAATQEIARSAEVASRRTIDTAGEVGRVSEATDDTRREAATVRTVAQAVGTVAGGIRTQVDAFFQNLRAA